MDGPNFQSADPRNATFQDAYLDVPNLQGADIRGANLQGIRLNAADLRGVGTRVGRQEDTHQYAIYDAQTT